MVIIVPVHVCICTCTCIACISIHLHVRVHHSVCYDIEGKHCEVYMLCNNIGKTRRMRHELRGRGTGRSNEQTMTLMIPTTDVGRIIGKILYFMGNTFFHMYMYSGVCTCTL